MLTQQQAKTFEFICRYIEQHGCAPKLQEIAKGLGISSRSNIHAYLQALVKHGLLFIEPLVARGIRLAENAERSFSRLKNPLSCPLVGKIAAGSPIEAIATPEELNLMPLLSNPNTFALKVKGNSMIDEGILDGDVVICEQRNTASNGEIVVALIDQSDATLKRLQKNNDKTITLIPANESLKPITYAANRIQIQGVFVGLIRM